MSVTYTLVVTPDPKTVPINETQQYAAALHGDDGSVVAVAVTWESSAGVMSPTGLLTPDAKLGTYTVTATQASLPSADPTDPYGPPPGGVTG